MTQLAATNLPGFGFHCRTCGGWHTDIPAIEVPWPVNLAATTEAERAARCVVETDFWMIDEAEFYARARLELPIVGFDRSFVWLVWVSLSKASSFQSVDMFDEPKRSHVGPFFGWLDSPLPTSLYPQTRGLKTMVHLRDDLLRPLVELEPTDHPLAVEQHRGMSIERAAEIVARLEDMGRS